MTPVDRVIALYFGGVGQEAIGRSGNGAWEEGLGMGLGRKVWEWGLGGRSGNGAWEEGLGKHDTRRRNVVLIVIVRG